MVQQGNWLFRYRSWLPLVLIVFALVSMYFERQRYGVNYFWYSLFCVLIALLGQFIRIIAVGYAADRTSGRNIKGQLADEINQTGIYSLMRHPLYVGNFFMWLGIALYTRIWWLVGFFLPIYWIYYERIILAEEAFLEDKFGAEYPAYADRVNCVFPDFRTYLPNKYYFRPNKVLRQENSGLMGLVLVFLVLELYQNLLFTLKVRLSLTWIITATLVSIGYLVLRFLKKKTGWLDNEVQRQKVNAEE